MEWAAAELPCRNPEAITPPLHYLAKKEFGKVG
jgi:hypothetical protein